MWLWTFKSFVINFNTNSPIYQLFMVETAIACKSAGFRSHFAIAFGKLKVMSQTWLIIYQFPRKIWILRCGNSSFETKSLNGLVNSNWILVLPLNLIKTPLEMSCADIFCCRTKSFFTKSPFASFCLIIICKLIFFHRTQRRMLMSCYFNVRPTILPFQINKEANGVIGF